MSSPAADSPASDSRVLCTEPKGLWNKGKKAAAAGVAGFIIFLIWHYGAELSSLVSHFTELLANQGSAGTAAFVGIGTLWIILLLPASMVFLASGAAWGLKWGFLIALTNNLLSGAIAFGIAKYFMEPYVEGLKPGESKLALVRRAVQREGPRGATLLRFSALPAWAVNYGLGAAGLSWKHYLAASFAILPNTWAYVAAGHAAGLASQDTPRSAVEWALLIASIVGTVIVMVLLGQRAKQVLEDTGP